MSLYQRCPTDPPNTGRKDDETWDKIAKAIECRRKLVESETKRVRDSHAFMTAPELKTFVQAVVGIVKANVTDARALRNISKQLMDVGAVTDS